MTILKTEDEARSFVSERCARDDFMRLEQFVSRLAEASHHQNLVSRSSLDAVWLRHVADSAQLMDHVPRETSTWMDLGTGAGFPGAVLAIMQPQRSFILVESRNLRIQWLNKMISELAIDNATVKPVDLRALPTEHAAVLSARAFAPLDRLVAQSARFSTNETRWVLPKGRSAAQEVKMLPSALQAMFHVKHSATSIDSRILVGVGKP